MIQVGSHKPGSVDKKFSYSDVEFDKDGWADVSKYLPILYDLMLLKDGAGKNLVGWYSGSQWDGLRYKGQNVTHWKRKMDDET